MIHGAGVLKPDSTFIAVNLLYSTISILLRPKGCNNLTIVTPCEKQLFDKNEGTVLVEENQYQSYLVAQDITHSFHSPTSNTTQIAKAIVIWEYAFLSTDYLHPLAHMHIRIPYLHTQSPLTVGFAFWIDNDDVVAILFDTASRI